MSDAFQILLYAALVCNGLAVIFGLLLLAR